MASKVLLIFGAGARVGGCTVRKFASEGWSVAAVSRTIRDEVKSHAALTFENDHSDPTSIKAIFDKVEQELGAPSAVIYNGKHSRTPSPRPSHARMRG
jgi:NAD(P)-dependent dehydrogenase (short-subunit alcohol dehydrogenase family)